MTGRLEPKRPERPPLRRGYGYAGPPPCTCVVEGPDYFGQYDLHEAADCPLHGWEPATTNKETP